MKTNWIGHILLRNCLLRDILERKIEWREGKEEEVSSYWMTLKKTRGYWQLQEEALYRIVYRTRFRRGCGPVVRQDCGMNGEYLIADYWFCIMAGYVWQQRTVHFHEVFLYHRTEHGSFSYRKPAAAGISSDSYGHRRSHKGKELRRDIYSCVCFMVTVVTHLLLCVLYGDSDTPALMCALIVYLTPEQVLLLEPAFV